MMDSAIVIGIAASAFIATNFDNLVLLVGLLGRYSDRRYEVMFAYFSGALIIGAVSYYIGKLAGNFPVTYVGFLGIFPVLIGVVELFRLFRNKGVVRDPTAPGLGSTAVAATLMVQLSNSSDTIVTFSVLFSDSNDLADHLVALSFLAMALIFAMAARSVLRYNWLSRPIQLYGHYITPLILITVGLFVLSNTALDLLPGT
jgi:cadmium resistance protein CadD (predicted permease)